VATDHELPLSIRKPAERVAMGAATVAVASFSRPEPLLNSDEAAAIMNIHPKTLQRLARQRLIRGVRIGTHWRFRASEIEAWYQQKIAG
jgi:excisionase family DNA binding protein